MIESIMPTSAQLSDLAQLAGAGWVVGFGAAAAFWLGGYVVGSLYRYLNGSY